MIKLLLVSLAIMPCKQSHLKQRSDVHYVKKNTVQMLKPEVQNCSKTNTKYEYCAVTIRNFRFVSPTSCNDIKEKYFKSVSK